MKACDGILYEHIAMGFWWDTTETSNKQYVDEKSIISLTKEVTGAITEVTILAVNAPSLGYDTEKTYTDHDLEMMIHKIMLTCLVARQTGHTGDIVWALRRRSLPRESTIGIRSPHVVSPIGEWPKPSASIPRP